MDGLTRAERRWNGHTWNLLLQIERATDGKDPLQRAGETDTPGLCAARSPEMRALERRRWARVFDTVEVVDQGGDRVRYLPCWEVTRLGRAALKAAKAEGITVQ
jgi:hypothetical protein